MNKIIIMLVSQKANETLNQNQKAKIINMLNIYPFIDVSFEISNHYTRYNIYITFFK